MAPTSSARPVASTGASIRPSARAPAVAVSRFSGPVTPRSTISSARPTPSRMPPSEPPISQAWALAISSCAVSLQGIERLDDAQLHLAQQLAGRFHLGGGGHGDAGGLVQLAGAGQRLHLGMHLLVGLRWWPRP